MKMLLDVEGKITENCILVHNGKCFIPVSKEIFLDDIHKLKKENEQLKKDIEKLNLHISFDRGEISEEDYSNELARLYK